MKRNNPETREIAFNFLNKNRVRIIFHEEVLKYEKKVLETNMKNRFIYDLVILCTGITPNSEFVDDYFLDGKNFIIVNEYLQMYGREKVFACGDVASISEEKTAQNAERHASVVIKNILALEENNLPIKYNSKKSPIIISLGKDYGIFEYKNLVLKGIIPAFLKWLVEKEIMLKYVIRNNKP